jgi:hypothetical protein
MPARKRLSLIEHLEQLRGLLLHQGLTSARFHVQPHEGLGVGGPQVEAPSAAALALEFHRQSVGEIDARRVRLVVLLHTRQDGLRIRVQMAIDLAAGGKQVPTRDDNGCPLATICWSTSSHGIIPLSQYENLRK